MSWRCSQRSFAAAALCRCCNVRLPYNLLSENGAMAQAPIGLFGGTFDPVHYGHLRTAFELWQSLGLEEVRFMPTGSPPHREQTYATAEHRVAMVKAAVQGQPAFTVDDREVRRSGVSYSVDTLTELRAENPN